MAVAEPQLLAASQGDGDGAFGQAATTCYGPTPDTVR